ncbi:PWI domain-containing protein [Hirsutella rhossiliensis]|uniref:PWI domain-containing protein n=1 Tax=Hirsutella rhossiliensis TaxID=111463 RepID=A0A9P8SH38_9HYPO|nr:PWI domain-containing protein [Hirsutella rhossiliensis]KAH0961130.1 PWI domain-containing protein [Hirsutella rhossiliensis]
MSYNQYGGNPYGAPPGFGGYGSLPPGMGAPPPGLGMAPPPGVAQPSTQPASRAAGLPSGFQPPANMPNINFNAPVIRLGTGASGSGGRGDGPSAPSGGRPGMGMERGGDQGRDRARDVPQILTPPTSDEKLRTIIIHQMPDGLGGDEGVQKICNAVGRLRKWEPAASLWSEHKSKLGFALFDDHESVSIALKLLGEQGIEVPVKRQQPTSNPTPDDTFKGIEKVKLGVAFDETTVEYQASLDENRGEDAEFQSRFESARVALKQLQLELFYPPAGTRVNADADAAATNNDVQGNVEVVNISIAQEDELADIPAEMREVVAKEIAAFRDRSNQRDMERLRREEEIGARFRQQNGASAPSLGGSNYIPLGPRSSTMQSAPSWPRGHNGTDRVTFVNGGARDPHHEAVDDDDDTDASDGELYRRELKIKEDEEHRLFIEMERKWLNRERSRQLALDREQDRERQETEQKQRRKDEQRARDMAWDDDLEANRKTHAYYRDHAAWARKRAMERQDEEMRDDADRREEEGERRREQAQMERARGQADSFLDRQDQETDRRPAVAAPAPQPFKLSLGAAAQRAQASRAMPQRRTIAEVEGLLDNEDAEPMVRRQLVPIQMDPVSGPGAMSEEEISQAIRALAQEIPSDKDGLWGWDVKWDYMDEAIVRERLRPFVEKKIVEYLGVQEEMLVETVEEHLRKHGTAGGLVDELEGALDDEAEDLVKKLWRMVIFFTECEKRNLPA